VTRSAKAVLIGISVATAINYAVSSFGGDILFNTGRVIVAFVGGWLVVSRGAAGLWVAASVGPLVMLIDHVILKGGYFIWAHYYLPQAMEGEGLLAAGGVLLSYAMFLPIAAVCSLMGGLAARNRRQGVQAHP